MRIGKFVHWFGILLILFACFADPIAGKEQNVLAYKSYAVILFGFALTILGIEATREGKRLSLLEILADWLFEEEPAQDAPEGAPPEGNRQEES